MSNRSLVAFYSMGGNTRALANELRDALLCHIEEIAEPRARKGFTGVMRALFDSMLGRAPPIAPAKRDPALYDLLVLGGPVWAGRIAAPVRSYARKYGARATKVAFFCTQGGGDPGTAFAELETLCGAKPVATLAIPGSMLAAKSHKEALSHFVSAATSPATTAAVPPGNFVPFAAPQPAHAASRPAAAMADPTESDK